jgi:hypothetical protein
MWKARTMRVIAEAAEACGGYGNLAKRLGVSEEALVGWAQGIGAPDDTVCGQLHDELRRSAVRAARAAILTRRDSGLRPAPARGPRPH